MSGCNGKCRLLKSPRIFGVSMYNLGYVRCVHECGCYFEKSKVRKTKRLRCPCCGATLRTKTPFKTKKYGSLNEMVVLA